MIMVMFSENTLKILEKYLLSFRSMTFLLYLLTNNVTEN